MIIITNENMKKQLVQLCVAISTLLLLNACEKELTAEESSGDIVGQQALSILTRGTGSDAKISYPVYIYVMNNDNTCNKKETLTEGNTLSLSLPAANYQVYAVAGATEWAYDLPTVSTARADYAIALKDNAVHADLMTASSATVVSKDGSNTLTLNLQRKVMQIKNLTIREVPSATEAVTVSISPLYKNLLLDGSYSEETEALTISLTKQSDGTTWQNASPLYALPASGSAKLTIKMTTASGTKSYSYTSPQALAANHEINITATYTENEALEIAGTVNGAEWDSPVDVTFSFDDSNSDDGSGSGDGVAPGTAPSAETWYKKCYVLTTADDGDYTVVTLMHKDVQSIACAGMTDEQIDAAVSAALPGFDMDDFTGWRLPTKAEASALVFAKFNSGVESAGGTTMGSSDIYLGKDNGEYFGFNYSSVNYGKAFVELIRPVTTVRFHK